LENNQINHHQFQFEEVPEGKTSAVPSSDNDPPPSDNEQQTAVFQVENVSLNPNRPTTSQTSVSRPQQSEASELRQESADGRHNQRKFLKFKMLRVICGICMKFLVICYA